MPAHRALARRGAVLLTVLLSLISFTLLQCGDLGAASDEWGSITVRNSSDRDVYITIDGYNQGALGRHDSHTYSVYQGDHTVCAHAENRTVSEDCTLTPSSPHYSWEIGSRDLE